MSRQGQSAAARPPAGGSAVVVVGIVALVLNLAVTALAVAGVRLSIPFNITGGFTFNLSALPLVTALIVAFALWRYAGVRQGPAVGAALLLFIVPVLVSFAVNFVTGRILEMLPNAVVTNATNFYGILFLKAAFSAASILFVALFFAPAFKDWHVWLYLIIVWAGGDTLLFFLFRNQAITRDVYQWLYPIERTLGFMVIAWQLQRRPAR